MASALARTHITADEYLAGEEASDIKHEYYDGEVFVMSGGTEQHNLIGGNTLADLHFQLRRGPCVVYNSDMKVKTQRTLVKKTLYTYPDLSVVCGKAKFETEKRLTLLNPIVLFEVLSSSTEGYDRGAKFESYRTIPSLQEYVLIAQDRVHLEHYIRQSDGKWLLAEYSQPSDTIYLPSIECTLVLEDIYEKVELAESDSTEQ